MAGRRPGHDLIQMGRHDRSCAVPAMRRGGPCATRFDLRIEIIGASQL
jgi:hypothetical protein